MGFKSQWPYSLPFTNLDHLPMLRHYFKVLIRTLLRNKTYAALNLLGLTGGMVAFLLIILYVQYEFSFDQYHENKDRIYRVAKQEKGNEYFGTDLFAVTPAPLAATLVDEYPEVENATHFIARKNVLIGLEERNYLVPEVYGTTAAAFDIFSFDVLAGRKEDFLKEKFTAVISESFGKKYFGAANPIGRTIQFREQYLFTVVGVIADMPDNGHFQTDLFLDFDGIMESEHPNAGNWNSSSFYTYVLFREGTDPQLVEAKFPALLSKYLPGNKPVAELTSRYFLQALPAIHLHSALNFEINANGNKQTLQIYLLWRPGEAFPGLTAMRVNRSSSMKVL